MRRPEDRYTELSEREDRAVLRYIDGFIRDNGYPPSRRQMLSIMGKTSPSEAQGCIERLRDAGLVDVMPGVARGMRITKTGMKALTEEM